MEDFLNRAMLSEAGIIWLLISCAVVVILLVSATLYFQFGWSVLRNFFRLRKEKKYYTREELKAAGYEVTDNSDLRELLILATKKAREQEHDSSFVGGLNKLKQATKSQVERRTDDTGIRRRNTET